MGDLANWKVHGPVHALRTEFAEWDLDREDSKETPAMTSYAIAGSELSYGAPDAATITTQYDDREQPEEVTFKDQDQRLLRRVVFTRDNLGRVVREDAHFGEQMPFPSIEKELENAPPEAREKALAMFTKIFGPQLIMSSTSYAYDEKGRIEERRTRMGELGDHRTTYRYDDHDNPVGEISEDSSRDMEFDAAGQPRPAKESSHTQNTRYEYKYDAEGNWTERVVWGRLEPNPNFERSNVERREITYYVQ